MRNQPDIRARKEYIDIVDDAVTVVPIPRTKRSVKLRWIKPYTLERLTRLWVERDIAAQKLDKGSDVLQSMAREPYFCFKEAALMVLNHDLKIRFFYPLYWRWLAFRYDETQVSDIVVAGKKKLPLESHYKSMVFSMDMRTDMMKMTSKEAEQFRAELLSAVKRPS